MEVSIKNTTRRAAPKLSYQDIKNSILGNKYELSLVFCGSTLSRRLNRTYRNKDKAANVLSFPLTKNSGEIFIDLSRSEQFGVLKLFVHGLLHLKGMAHGRRMEEAEIKFENKFTNGTAPHSRNRHRKLPDQSGDRGGIRRASR